AKYGSGDVLKKVAIFGTNPIGSNDRSDSSNYLVFNSLGTFGVANSSNNSFTPLNAYGTSATPLSNLYTTALTMSNSTFIDSFSSRFLQPSMYVQSVVYTSNDVNVGGSLNVTNNFSIGGSFSVGSSLSTNSNLYVAGNAAFGVALSNALAPVHMNNVDANSNSLYVSGAISACNMTVRSGGVMNIFGNVSQKRGIKFDNSVSQQLTRAIQIVGDDATHNNFVGIGASGNYLQLCAYSEVRMYSENSECFRAGVSGISTRFNVSGSNFTGSNFTMSSLTVNNGVTIGGTTSCGNINSTGDINGKNINVTNGDANIKNLYVNNGNTVFGSAGSFVVNSSATL
ncbi:MAG: hypothetical protein EBU08_23740, partial [Micrococcales bacterium]|nr:hypothetical protein [Micrococcales bacterium]